MTSHWKIFSLSRSYQWNEWGARGAGRGRMKKKCCVNRGESINVHNDYDVVFVKEVWEIFWIKQMDSGRYFMLCGWTKILSLCDSILFQCWWFSMWFFVHVEDVNEIGWCGKFRWFGLIWMACCVLVFWEKKINL